MTGFALGACLLLALAAWMLRPALRSHAATDSPRAPHLGILREQLAALDLELADGRIDAGEHRSACHELQRRALEDAVDEPETPAHANRRAVAWTLAIAGPALTLSIYAALGSPAAFETEAGDGSAGTAPSDVAPEDVQAMLQRLAQRLETPSAFPAADAQGWTMLARSYAALQRFADADKAYARAIALAPGDAQLLADRADVLGMLQAPGAAAESERLLAQALQLDPNNLKALALAGTAAYMRRDYVTARVHWQRARELAPPDSEFAAGLDRSLAEVRSGGTGPGTQAPDSERAQVAGPAAARIAGRVELAPGLATRVAPGDTVFVVARAATGPRMPLAVLRRTVAELPFDFDLDDSRSMAPSMRLSNHDRVVVSARISRSGNAAPQPGDLYGESGELSNRSTGVQLRIVAAQP